MVFESMNPDDSNDEPKMYQEGTEYPVKFTGHFVTPIFHVAPQVPGDYFEHDDSFSEAMASWVEEEDPLMGPSQFKEFVTENGKDIFAGEKKLRTQSVIKTTAVHDEWRKDKEEVQYGFRYLIAFYYTDGYIEDGDERIRRAECLSKHDIERWQEQVDEMFNNTPYIVTDYTIVPYKVGEKPLDKQYEM